MMPLDLSPIDAAALRRAAREYDEELSATGHWNLRLPLLPRRVTNAQQAELAEALA